MPSLKEPSRNDVELALKALEVEDEREKEAIRLFWERQRQVQPKPREVTGRSMLGIAVFCLVLAGLILWGMFRP